VLLGRPSEVGPPGVGGAAGPEKRAAGLDLRREDLILEIAGLESRAADERKHALRLGDIAGQRLLTGDAGEIGVAPHDRVGELLHVFHAGLVRPADPDRVDVRVHHHLADRTERPAGTDVEPAGIGGRGFRILAIRAPHPADFAVANPTKGLHVESGVEAGADEANAECHGVPGERWSRGAAKTDQEILQEVGWWASGLVG